jgi:hypothetical protein
MTDRQWVRSIRGGLSLAAIAEYLMLCDCLENVELNDQLDRTVWCWTPDGKYSVKSAYVTLHSGSIQFSGHS